ncbi:hypothetical protein MTO96_041846 [Rhipicephalus appendiculatus]
MNSTADSFNHTVYQPCVSVKKAERRALCEDTNFTGGPENFLKYPIIAYGVRSNASKVLALSEFNNSLAVKFNRTVKKFGVYRARTAWLLYNVHNLASGNQVWRSSVQRRQTVLYGLERREGTDVPRLIYCFVDYKYRVSY